MPRPLVLLVNDDGYKAEGMRSVAAAVLEFADVVCLAPAVNQSAKSMSISLALPLKLEKHEEPAADAPRKLWVFSLTGTPVDCVIFAFHKLLPDLGLKPDCVVSGINHGANLGADLLVSGTVGAAMYASVHYGILAVAASVVHRSATSQPEHPTAADPGHVVAEKLEFGTASSFVGTFVHRLLDSTVPTLRDVIFNINVPNDGLATPGPPSAYAITSPGSVNYTGPAFVQKPGSTDFFLSGTPALLDIPGSDCNAVSAGVISVTPLSVRAPLASPEEEAKRLASFDEPEDAVEAGEGERAVLSRARIVQPTALVCKLGAAWLGSQAFSGFAPDGALAESFPAPGDAGLVPWRWHLGVAALAGAVVGVTLGRAFSKR